jgi:hypothetical protein
MMRPTVTAEHAGPATHSRTYPAQSAPRTLGGITVGKAPSIKELEEKDAEFRAYLNNLEADLDGRAQKAKDAMGAEIVKFYENNHYDDNKQFVSGQNTDFMHTAEFNMDNVKKIVDAISDAVFAGTGKTPSGADVDKKTVAEAGVALEKEAVKMAELELYIAGKVFDVLSAIVLSFGANTSISYSSTYKTEPLGFGLQLFTTVAASSYKSSSFFHDEYISQYLYLYDVRFSVKQAQAEATMGVLKAYENQLDTFESLLTKLGDQLDAGKITLEAYTNLLDTYMNFIKKFKTEIDNLKATEVADAAAAAAIGGSLS